MIGKISKLLNNIGQYIYPITVSDAVYVETSKNLKTKLTEIDEAIANVGGVSGSIATSNLAIGGDVKFSVDFTNNTIAWTDWQLYTSYGIYTLSSGSATFTTQMASTTFYYVCFRNGTFEVIAPSNINSYNGIVVFGFINKVIMPLAYDYRLIGVRSGTIFHHREVSIGEWTAIGDSLTVGNSWVARVQDQFSIPMFTNLALGGRRMAGSAGMWQCVDTTPATTELVTIMGGTNDGASASGSIQPIGSTFNTDTYVGAYQYLIEGLLNKNPRMRIILMTPPRSWASLPATRDNLNANLESLVGQYVKDIGNYYNLPVIDTYNGLGINELNQSIYLVDGLHFTSEGHEKLAKLVCGALKQYY